MAFVSYDLRCRDDGDDDGDGEEDDEEHDSCVDAMAEKRVKIVMVTMVASHAEDCEWSG